MRSKQQLQQPQEFRPGPAMGLSAGGIFVWASAALNLLFVGLVVSQLWSPIRHDVRETVAPEGSVAHMPSECFQEVHDLTGILKRVLDGSDELRKEIAELREKVNAQAVNDSPVSGGANMSKISWAEEKGRK